MSVPRRPSTVMARVVLQFAVPGLLVLLLVGLGAVLLFRDRSEQEAIRDARQLTRAIGHGMIEPRLDGRIVGQDPRAVAALDRYVRTKVLPIEPSLVRMKLWTRDGRLIYSDDARLIGTRAPLAADEAAVLGTDDVIAEVSDLARPENRLERGHGRLLEVYLPLHNVDGVPVLFETYLHYSSVADDARGIWLTFAPVLIAALMLLWIVQLPLAWSFGRRLRRHEREREALLLKAMHASEDERRRIAGDLHDGVMQDLTGISMTLGAAMHRARGTDLEPLLARASESTRQSIREMRSLMVDIAPVSVHEEGLDGALEDLMPRLTARGVRTQARIHGPLKASGAVEQLAFRVVREALRTAQKRSGLSAVDLRADVQDGALVVEVQDDGRRPEAGGDEVVEALRERVAEVGGTLDVGPRPGGGTRVRLAVPARAPVV